MKRIAGLLLAALVVMTFGLMFIFGGGLMNSAPRPRYDLPSNRTEATRELRRRMIEEWRPILEHLSFPVGSTGFGVDYESDIDRTRASLAVGFGKFPESEWKAVEAEFDRVSSQWVEGGSLRPGSQTGFGLIGGCRISGCGWILDSGKVHQELDAGVFAGHAGEVPELMPPMLVPHGTRATLTPGEPTGDSLSPKPDPSSEGDISNAPSTVAIREPDEAPADRPRLNMT